MGSFFAWALGVALLLANLYTLRDLALNVARGYPHPWRNYHQAANWIRENTAEDAMVVCRKSYWMNVVSNRHSDVFVFAEPKTLMADLEAKGADYVVLEHLGYSQTAEYLLPTLKEYSDRFNGVWYMPKPSTFVVELLPPDVPATNPPELVPPDG